MGSILPPARSGSDRKLNAVTTAAEIPSLDLCGQVFEAVQEIAVVVSQEQVAANTFRMRLECPGVAAQIRPGQFFMVRSLERSDPLLGRPFALLDIIRNSGGEVTGLDFGYVVVGKMTQLLSQLDGGARLSIWGPLGNGFSLPQAEHVAIVAGGIGQTPFVAMLRELLGLETYGSSPRPLLHKPQQLTFCYGARTAAALAGVEWFDLPGVDVRLATDDGSRGHHGFVTDVLRQLIAGEAAPGEVYCCGPEPMMRAVANLINPAGIPGWLSLETPMACGFGACFSCVARIRQPDGTWDYRRSCVEGPVFPAADLVFAEDA